MHQRTELDMRFRRHPVANIDRSDLLAGAPVDAALVTRLRATYERVRERDLRFAELFYAKLFAAAPELRSMFKSDLNAQAAKLTASLDAVVRNLESPEQNSAMLAELGKRHAGYGAKPAHYDLVIDLLIEAMRETLAESSPGGTAGEALREWRTALRLVSDQMIATSQSPAPDDAG